MIHCIITNRIMQIMINLPQILMWPIRPNLKLFGLMKQSYGPKKLNHFPDNVSLLLSFFSWGCKSRFASLVVWCVIVLHVT